MTDIERKRGDTYPVELTVTDSAGTAIDITSYTFLLTVDPEKAPTADTNNLFQLTGVITDATGGVVTFTPTASNTDAVGTYYYDIQMTDSGGLISTLDSGKFKLVQDITK